MLTTVVTIRVHELCPQHSLQMKQLPADQHRMPKCFTSVLQHASHGLGVTHSETSTHAYVVLYATSNSSACILSVMFICPLQGAARASFSYPNFLVHSAQNSRLTCKAPHMQSGG